MSLISENCLPEGNTRHACISRHKQDVHVFYRRTSYPCPTHDKVESGTAASIRYIQEFMGKVYVNY